MAREPVAVAADAARVPRAAARSRFFIGVAVLLLAFVLSGFARTFFLRPFFDVLPVPSYVYLHGAIVTTWFVLVVAQTILVAADRTHVHRRLGVVAALVAVAVVLLSLNAVLRFPYRIATEDVEGEEQGLGGVGIVVWLDLVSLLLFMAFVGAALYWRKRTDTHKRLMLLASIAIIGPATARLLFWIPGFPILGAVLVAMPLLLPFALVAHDLLGSRRLHRATGIGGGRSRGPLFDRDGRRSRYASAVLNIASMRPHARSASSLL